jgi:hypothetical protein
MHATPVGRDQQFALRFPAKTSWCCPENSSHQVNSVAGHGDHGDHGNPTDQGPVLVVVTVVVVLVLGLGLGLGQQQE